MSRPIQKILFGSPGTGKSYKVREIATESLGIKWNEETKTLENTIKTVFHPEYTYSDFVGKLLPLTTGDGSVIYKFYEGHFTRALGLAYSKIIEGTNENVLLVIDELNRGNAAAIFGSIFQLLDRDEDNWSTYDVSLSELEIVGILRAMGYEVKTYHDNIQVKKSEINEFLNNLQEKLNLNNNYDGVRVVANLKKSQILIPSNLSIVATINTSDESIYYLDSAFKRRWSWEYVDVPGGKFSEEVPEEIKDIMLYNRGKQVKWYTFVSKLNEFIKSNHDAIRRIEDKQIGWWFLKAQDKKIQNDDIKNKLMFYLWDSVFSKDKRPLEKHLETNLITYADFAALSEEFLFKIVPEKDWEVLPRKHDYDDEEVEIGNG
jgi:5-methylcytosine-specific restriction endonuclease McrBC GTP-binding regulatory subunit McrB